jgi:hypothetical protein
MLQEQTAKHEWQRLYSKRLQLQSRQLLFLKTKT